MTAGFRVCAVEVFGWSKQPVEGDNDEVDGVTVGSSPFWVFEVQGVEHSTDNGEVDWVGSAWGRVFSAQSFEESIQ